MVVIEFEDTKRSPLIRAKLRGQFNQVPTAEAVVAREMLSSNIIRGGSTMMMMMSAKFIRENQLGRRATFEAGWRAGWLALTLAIARALFVRANTRIGPRWTNNGQHSAAIIGLNSNLFVGAIPLLR